MQLLFSTVELYLPVPVPLALLVRSLDGRV